MDSKNYSTLAARAASSGGLPRASQSSVATTEAEKVVRCLNCRRRQ